MDCRNFAKTMMIIAGFQQNVLTGKTGIGNGDIESLIKIRIR
jgi:hypothetical protein